MIKVLLIFLLSIGIMYIVNVIRLASYISKQPDTLNSVLIIACNIVFKPRSRDPGKFVLLDQLKYHKNFLTGQHLTMYRGFIDMLNEMSEEEYVAFNKAMDNYLLIVESFTIPVILNPLLQSSKDIKEFDTRKARSITDLEYILKSEADGKPLTELMLIKINSFAQDSGLDALEVAEQSKSYLNDLDLKVLNARHFKNTP